MYCILFVFVFNRFLQFNIKVILNFVYLICNNYVQKTTLVTPTTTLSTISSFSCVLCVRLALHQYNTRSCGKYLKSKIMSDDQPTHSGASKHCDSEPAAFNDLQNKQLIFCTGEKITHTITKSNLHAWFSYFEKLCIRLANLSDDEKLRA